METHAMKLNTSEIPDIVIDDLKATIEKAIMPHRIFLFAALSTLKRTGGALNWSS
jgi:hypothetical protein